ncbi:MAG: PorT family protein [Maribacter sp.]|nr:PorT family protein [Maribacter sp.]
MKRIILGLLSLFYLGLNAQTPQVFNTGNSNYLEDQFYLGLTYNFLLDKPSDFKQTNLSYGLQGGIIKDIPINNKRTFAIGLGLGYAVNSYYSNLVANESNDGIVYAIASETDLVKRSKFETHLVEFPIEIRWRDSTSEEYKFWRVYSGIKLGYVFGSRSKVVTIEDKISFINPNIRKFQYGLMFNFGYNTFNVHFYYSLKSLLEDGVVLGTEELNMKPLRVGLIFYIL